MKRRSICAGSRRPRRDTVGRAGSRERPATIALLAATVLLLATAPAALATERVESKPFDGEGIEGRAVDATSSAGIAGIEVCAYATDSEETSGLFGECTETNAAGEYALLGLSASEYFVEFATPFNSDVNYVTQYFDGAASIAEATPVTIEPNSIRTEIDAALDTGGRVEGRVTDASGGAPLDGILICALDSEAEQGACAKSASNGEYLVTGLAGGEYAVGFFAVAESGLDYLTQYYSGEPTLAKADPVTVTVAQTTPGVDAALQSGGEISGRVTDSATGAAAPGILACALSAAGKAVECAETASTGDYTIERLPVGEYMVGFDGAGKYVTQYYDDRFSLAEAQAVPVTLGNVATGIDAAMGTTAAAPPGEGVTPPAFPTPVPLAVPESATTATAAAASSVLASMTAGLPPKSNARARLLASSTIVASKGKANVHLRCSGEACRGSVELTMRIATTSRKAGRNVSHVVTLVLARGSFSIAPGGAVTASLRLSQAGRRRLASAARHAVAAELTLAVAGEKPTTKPVRVR
jgi:hypothetical protein